MILADVISKLLDVPSTFKRNDTAYSQWVQSLAVGLNRYTQASDALMSQATLQSAQGKWLDVWGLLFGLPRHNSESDSNYLQRIRGSIVASNASPVAIESFLLVSRGFTATVSESLPTLGWSLTLPSDATVTQSLPALASDLGRVRPAGVPYNFRVLRGGLYLSTVNYLGRANTTGSYLVNPVRVLAPPIGPATNNATPLLPTEFLTDPVLNPNL